MKQGKAMPMFLLCTTLSMGWLSVGVASELQEVAVMVFEGQVKAVKINICGLQPGRCEGSMVLAKREGGEVSLAIKPGIQIRRGEQHLIVDELGAGDYVKVQATQMAGDTAPRITVLEVMLP